MASSPEQSVCADTHQAIEVIPLTLHIGAEIRGADLTEPLPEHSSSDGWKPGLVGGLIYSGPCAPSDGSAPSFSVSLNPDAATGRKHMWSIHT